MFIYWDYNQPNISGALLKVISLVCLGCTSNPTHNLEPDQQKRNDMNEFCDVIIYL